MRSKFAITYEVTLNTDLIEEVLNEKCGVTEADIKLSLRKYGINSCYAIDAEVIDISEDKNES